MDMVWWLHTGKAQGLFRVLMYSIVIISAEFYRMDFSLYISFLLCLEIVVLIIINMIILTQHPSRPSRPPSSQGTGLYKCSVSQCNSLCFDITARSVFVKVLLTTDQPAPPRPHLHSASSIRFLFYYGRPPHPPLLMYSFQSTNWMCLISNKSI